jgi:squalene-associated FAD-dependent desaturase
MTSRPSEPSPTVAVAGGGLAGLAAACALADSGFRVTVFERRPYLGGRASSYEHPGTGEVVDNCQHVLFRTCTNLIEFYHRIGVDHEIRWFDQMTFIEPGGRTSVMKSSFLPAPLHTAPSFLSFPFLSAQDKFAIARAMVPLTLATQRDTGKSFQQWLQQHGQTAGAIQRFWKPILISALSEELELMSISYAAQVVRESMKSPAARQMGVPAIPLTTLYNAAGDYIRQRHGEIHFRRPLDTFHAESSQVRLQFRENQEKSSGQSSANAALDKGTSPTPNEQAFDYLVLALPFDTLDRVLPPAPESGPLRDMLGHFHSSPITGIHLWFDREISDLDHAVLLDRTIQWMFHKSRLLRREGEDAPSFRALSERVGGSYVELVVSSSKMLIEKSRAEIIDLALSELREFFPAAREAKLVKSTVIKEIHATYSPRPGIDTHRPPATTAWPRVFLAGDWTATGWPATMEGAVRSGYLAAQALTRATGSSPSRFIVPDLAASGLMRLFA